MKYERPSGDGNSMRALEDSSGCCSPERHPRFVLDLTEQVRLASQQAPEFHLCVSSPRIRRMSHCLTFYVGSGAAAQVLKSTVPAELSPNFKVVLLARETAKQQHVC